jgi:hypothetical protein
VELDPVGMNLDFIADVPRQFLAEPMLIGAIFRDDVQNELVHFQRIVIAFAQFDLP